VTSEAKSLLVLESDDGIREMIQSIVLDHDLSMQSAYDLADAKRLISKGRTLAFACDLSHVDEDPLTFARRFRQEHPELPLIALAGAPFQSLTVALLQVGTYACVDIPLQIGDLSYILSKIMASNADSYNPFAMRYEERILIMPNDFSLVMHVAKNLVDSTLPMHEKNRYHIILGLSEVVNNAIEHGNLGITFEEKSDALKASRFYPLAIERSHKDPFKDRVVTIRSRVFPNLRRIEYFVADQGCGFDWRSLPDPKDKSNLLNRNGRGIMMARYAFDEMIYNDTGNEVTLVVNLDVPYRGRRT
jgi:anti-sigma regulatory factor (Ser/Thr protein kinase)